MLDSSDRTTMEASEVRPLLARGASSVSIIGTVRLTEGLSEGRIVYVPLATADPRDPLNMKPWHKVAVVVVLSSFSTIGLSLVSGFGGLLGFYVPRYIAEGKSYSSITKLVTYPMLFMGLGNLIGMPIAISLGRRVVVLVATLILLLGAILCATSVSFEWHLAARMLLGLAAGQSESVVPMIINEIHFLHERSRGLIIQQMVQTIAGTTWVLCASPIAGAFSPEWWYGLGAAFAGLQFLASIFLLPETKYNRSQNSRQELNETAESVNNSQSIRPPLDLDKFPPRTWKSDMRIWVDTAEWRRGSHTLKQAMEMFLFPSILWVICLSGFTLGVNVAISATYGMIITAPPYNWSNASISYVNCGQIPVALIAFPLLGHWSDKFIQWKARRNGGIHEPENRLIPLILPIIIGVFTVVLYGQGASYPFRYHWFLYIWASAGYFFTFVGGTIISITYLLDSYPDRAGPCLLIVCICRGIIAFSITYGIAPFINAIGYDGTFMAFGGLTAILGLMAIPIFIFGKRIRAYTGRRTKVV